MSTLLQDSRRIVVKLGTRVLTQDDGTLAIDRLRGFLEDLVPARKSGKQILIVTSGAVGQGRSKLKLSGSLSLPQKQACAAVGQARLMRAYEELTEPHQQVVAQILLTAQDLADRGRYLNLQGTLQVLLEMGTIPVINENDTVSSRELREGPGEASFGDNDKLSALLAGKVDADLLVLLTDVDGLYTANPKLDPDATLVREIQKLEDLKQYDLKGTSTGGRGGMQSKVEAARLAALCGVHTVVANGLRPRILSEIFGHETNSSQTFPGTWIRRVSDVSKRKQWIGFSSGYQGAVVINAGACEALERKQASLLPVGIIGVQGEFSRNQVVSVQDEHGNEVARGLARFSSEECKRILGKKSAEVTSIFSGRANEFIHRDDLVIFNEGES